MLRAALVAIPLALLAGCGLAGTTAATGASTAASAEEAKQAHQQVQQVQERLDAAQRTAADARAAADRAAD